jgi:hypothetical protein
MVGTTGFNNTAVGYNSMLTVQGKFNTSLGSFALSSTGSNLIGSNNTAVGYEALACNNADSNTALGFQSMQKNTGTNNIGIGTNSLLNSSGSNNIVIGVNGGHIYNSESNNILIGATGISGDSNLIRIGENQTNFFVSSLQNVFNTGLSGYANTYMNSNNILQYYNYYSPPVIIINIDNNGVNGVDYWDNEIRNKPFISETIVLFSSYTLNNTFILPENVQTGDKLILIKTNVPNSLIIKTPLSTNHIYRLNDGLIKASGDILTMKSGVSYIELMYLNSNEWTGNGQFNIG